MNISRAFEVFHADVADQPPLTLRGANAVDSYSQPMPFDPAEDDPSDCYDFTSGFRGTAFAP